MGDVSRSCWSTLIAAGAPTKRSVRADTALYRVKAAGRDRVQRSEARLPLELDLALRGRGVAAATVAVAFSLSVAV